MNTQQLALLNDTPMGAYERARVFNTTDKVVYSPAGLPEFLSYFSNTPEVKTFYIMQGVRGAERVHVKATPEQLTPDYVTDQMARLTEGGCTDLYLTPQAFKGWRTKDLCWRVNALHVEIDTLNHKQLSEAEGETVVKQVTDTLRRAKLPAPNAMVQSGSGGLHLYWFVNETHAYNRIKRQWLSMAKTLTKRIQDKRPKGALWIVDTGASHDITRLLRVPGSVHKSGNTVRVRTADIPAYDFQVLSNALKVKPEPRAEFQPDLPLEPKRTYTRINNLRSYHASVVFHLSSYIRSGAVREQGADWPMHLVLASMLQIMDEQAARKQMTDLNRYCGFTEAELERFMSTTYKKRYTYSKGKLNCIFAANGIPLIPTKVRTKLEPEERKRVLSESARKAAAVKRENTLAKITDTLINKAGATQSDVAAETGLSLRTVKRYWHDAQTNADKQDTGLKVVSLASVQYNPSPKGNERGSVFEQSEGVVGRHFTEVNADLLGSGPPPDP